MKLEEALSEVTKPKYRELAKIYHPDMGTSPDMRKMQEINAAKDAGDDALLRKYRELMNAKPKAPIGTDKKTLEKWIDEINDHLFKVFLLVKLDNRDNPFIEIKQYVGRDIETKFIMNANTIKSKEDLMSRLSKLL